MFHCKNKPTNNLPDFYLVHGDVNKPSSCKKKDITYWVHTVLYFDDLVEIKSPPPFPNPPTL
jgi:hypothetical protein